MSRLLLILFFLATHAYAQQPPVQHQQPAAQHQQPPFQHQQPPAQSQSQPHSSDALLNVGDIPFDPALDDPAFQLNDSTRVFQYYNSNSWWLDHKDAYRDLFMKAACHLRGEPAAQTQSGWLTIRFIVNTAGETGRYRTFEMDSTYAPFHFDPRLTACLLATVKTAHWEPAHYRGKTYDTYQYVTLKFEQGRIVDIMP